MSQFPTKTELLSCEHHKITANIIVRFTNIVSATASDKLTNIFTDFGAQQTPHLNLTEAQTCNVLNETFLLTWAILMRTDLSPVSLAETRW